MRKPRDPSNRGELPFACVPEAQFTIPISSYASILQAPIKLEMIYSSLWVLLWKLEVAYLSGRSISKLSGRSISKRGLFGWTNTLKCKDGHQPLVPLWLASFVNRKHSSGWHCWVKGESPLISVRIAGSICEVWYERNASRSGLAWVTWVSEPTGLLKIVLDYFRG